MRGQESPKAEKSSLISVQYLVEWGEEGTF